MTQSTKPDQQRAENPQQSILADPYPKVRVTQAQLAKMLGCSKQAIGGHVKRGTITLGPDGKVDPEVAFRQLMANADPARLRIKSLRPAVADNAELHQQIAERDERIAYLSSFVDALDETHLKFMDLIVHRWPELSQLDISKIDDELDEIADLASLIVGGYEADPTQIDEGETHDPDESTNDEHPLQEVREKG